MKKGTAILTVLLALGLASSLAMAEETPAAALPAAAVSSKQEKTPAPSVHSTSQTAQDKTEPAAEKDKASEEQKEDGADKNEKDKKAAVETPHVPTDEDKAWLKSLDTLTIAPLKNSDFYIGSIHCGDSPEKVKRVFGQPSKYSRSTHYTQFQYDDKNYNLRFSFLNATADSLRFGSDTRKPIRPGAETIYVTSGANILIGRNVRLKYPAEVLVRQLGLPNVVLRDADANVYYFVYESPDKEDMYVFAIGNRHIERVALMPVRPPYLNGDEKQEKKKRTEHDFTLMGFGLNQPFQANKYNMWNSLVKRNGNNFWLYGDYGVEVDRHNQVEKVFLLTNNAYTGRGATLGYHVSTILALYGWPDRIERGPDKEKAVDALYYDSPYQKGVSLVIVLRHDEPYVDDVILTNSPITNLQDPMQRYGLK